MICPLRCVFFMSFLWRETIDNATDHGSILDVQKFSRIYPRNILGIIYDILLREVFEPWIKPFVQVPCVVARGECDSADVRCTPMMECQEVVIEGRPSKLGRHRVYHRDGCSSIGPRHRRCPRFCAALISARQHLIHIVATLSHPLCADLTAHSLSSADFS